jgi:hypothetical protein
MMERLWAAIRIFVTGVGGCIILIVAAILLVNFVAWYASTHGWTKL